MLSMCKSVLEVQSFDAFPLSVPVGEGDGEFRKKIF
jgi:hypothetical protein